MATQTLYALIKGAATGGAKVGARIKELVSLPDKEGHKELISAAELIETNYPVKKVDGVDTNRADRNNLLSILRMHLRRAGKAMSPAVTLTIKKIEGVWQVVESDEAPADTVDEAPQAGDASAESEASEDAKEAEATKVWDAVAIVLANLGNKAVRQAIADQLAKEMAKVRN